MFKNIREKLRALSPGPDSRIASFYRKDENRKRAALIMGVALLLTFIQLGKGIGGGQKYITDDSGDVRGLYREDSGTEAAYPLKLKAKNGKIETKRDLVLMLRGEEEKGTEKSPEATRSKVDQEIDQMISEVEASKGKRITLPGRLDDGTVLKWSVSRDASGIMFILGAPVLVLLLYTDEVRKEAERAKKRRASILRGLPGFTDQLLLLMDAGLVFQDAYSRIAAGYEEAFKRGEAKDDFRRLITDAELKSHTENRNIIRVLREQAAREGVREFSRVVGILSEHLFRGTDVSGKLRMESRILWESRKKMAEEQGRLAETKLTFPLAMLLLVLILITAAPAVLQTKGA